MPGFNGMGPQGEGAMTGWGRGFCMRYVAPGAGFVQRFGRGGGRGWRNCFNITGLPGWARWAPGRGPAGAAFDFSPPSGGQGLEFLKEQALFLEKSLGQVKKKIEELEKKE